MGLAVPITNGHLAAGAQTFSGGASSGVSPPPEASSAAAVQGTGSLMAPHNTPLHVAGILLLAGGVILGLHVLGFRFAFDVGMGR